MTLAVLPLVVALAQVQPLIIPGERLTYEVSSARFGRLGRAYFSVTTLDNGHVQLSFDFRAKVLLFSASDHTTSELDARTLRTLRYVKRERSPLGKHNEDVVIDHASSTWTGNGKSHSLACTDALDELSFIYLIRGLELAPGEKRVLTHHFDRARNPVVVRALTSLDDAIEIVEMSVPDKRQENGSSVLRFHLARGPHRIPVRIESTIPLVGRITMTLVR